VKSQARKKVYLGKGLNEQTSENRMVKIHPAATTVCTKQNEKM
jgi:hypothetical protein